MGKVKGKVKRASKRHLAQLRRRLRGRYGEVAKDVDRSWFMVWAVLNGKKTSAHILEAAERKATA